MKNIETLNSLPFLLCLLLLTPVICEAQKPELVVQTGHSDFINSIVFSPDGKLIASGSRDGIIKLWDVKNGSELRNLLGHSRGELSLVFSPDGKILASGSWDKTIRLWDVESGRQLRILTGHAKEIEAIKFSPNGLILASGSWDQTVKLWDVRSGKEIKTLIGHDYYVYSISFSPDGKMIASGSLGAIKLWDVERGKEIRSLAGHSSYVYSILFSPDGRRLASSSKDDTTRLWDIESGQEIYSLKIYSRSISYSPDGKTLAGGVNDGLIRLWDVENGKEMRSIESSYRAITSISFSPDGKILAGGGDDEIIWLWDVASGKKLGTLARHSFGFERIAFSNDGEVLANTGYLSNKFKLWKLGNNIELLSLKVGGTSVGPLSISPEGKILAAASGKIIELRDVESGKELRTLSNSAAVAQMTFSRDGRILAAGTATSVHIPGAGSSDNEIKLWDVESGKEIHTIKHTFNVNSMSFSPDGKTLATGSANRRVRLWDVESGKWLRTIEAPPNIAISGPFNIVRAVSFSLDGKMLAIWNSSSKLIEIWDAVSWTHLETLDVNSPATKQKALKLFPRIYERVYGGVVSEKIIAERAENSTLTLFEKETHKELASLIALDEEDWAVVTPEGRFDASPGGMKLMHYAYGLETIDLQQLKERYYEPGLLAKLTGFNKEMLREVVDFKSVELFPSVEITRFAEDRGELTVALSNRGGGIGRVQVFVNDKEFIADARPNGFDPSVKQAVLDFDLRGAPIVAGKPNRLRVVTYNQEGYLSSRSTLLSWVAPAAPAAAPELYAIVAGISDYSSPQLKLRYAAKDAADMAKAFELGAKALFGADRVHVKLLSSDKSNPRALPPTKANFRKAFEEFGRTKPTDVLVVYLAGHGITLPRSDTYLYLTQEARSKDGSVLSDPAVRKLTSISSDELVEWIKKVPALKQVMILDTCAAGAAAVRLVERKGVTGDQIRAIERLKDRTGFHVLMGSAADAASYEASQYGQGILTYVLLQGMSGAALRDEEFVDVQKLFQYAADGVPQLAKNIGGVQRPIVAAPGGTSFDVGRLSGKDKADIPLSKVKPLVLRPRLTLQELGDDTLGLMRELRERLRDASYFSEADNAPPKFVYIDEEELPGALRLAGTYAVDGEMVRIKMFLRRDDQTIRPLPTVEGSSRDVPALADKVFGLLMKALDDAANL